MDFHEKTHPYSFLFFSLESSLLNKFNKTNDIIVAFLRFTTVILAVYRSLLVETANNEKLLFLYPLILHFSNHMLALVYSKSLRHAED